MKDGTKTWLEGVAVLPAIGGVSQRPGRTSWHELVTSLRSAITQTTPPREAVTPPHERAPEPDSAPDDLESTRTLLGLARAGDRGAQDRLMRRYLPALQSWARGRVPPQVRRMNDTDDLVQMTLLRAFQNMDRIEYLHEGGFFAYLRTVLRNQSVDLVRRAEARPEGEDLTEGLEEPGASPFDRAVGREVVEAYEAALETLTDQQRAAITLRIELRLTFPEVADAVGCPSANAARMLCARAAVRLSEAMDEHGKT